MEITTSTETSYSSWAASISNPQKILVKLCSCSESRPLTSKTHWCCRTDRVCAWDTEGSLCVYCKPVYWGLVCVCYSLVSETTSVFASKQTSCTELRKILRLHWSFPKSSGWKTGVFFPQFLQSWSVGSCSRWWEDPLKSSLQISSNLQLQPDGNKSGMLI